MNIKEYEWENYMSYNKLQKKQESYLLLFYIRDRVYEANQKRQKKLIISLNISKDKNVVLAIAGSIHKWWVIDYVVEDQNKITLLYRNCQINRNPNLEKFWSKYLLKEEEKIIKFNKHRYHNTLMFTM